MATRNELVSHLQKGFGGSWGEGAEEGFMFSAEVAIYWFAYNYHEGQASDLYSVLSTSPYSPSCLCGGIQDEEDDLANDMYLDLVEEFGS